MTALAGIVAGDVGTGSSGVAVGVSIGFAVAAAVASRAIRLPLDCTSDATLSTSYLRASLVRLASAEAPFLVAFAAALWSGEPWVVLPALPFTAYGLAVVAPVPRTLAREQVRLHATGCDRDLARALRVAP